VSAPFIDTASADYDRDIHSAHASARKVSWYADTPFGILVLRYDDVHWLLHDKRWRELGNDALPAAGITEGPLWDWFHQILSNKEGEEHARLRRFVARAFTPRRAEALRPMMRATAETLIDGFIERGECEFVSEFAAGYPLRVIGTLIGVPPGDFTQFHTWANDLSLAFSSRIQEERPRIEAGLVNLSEYVGALIEERRRAPRDDLVSALIASEDVADPLAPEELRAMVTVLIFGGQDTTQCQLACAGLTFAEHPEQWELLARRPDLAAGAAEEVLRYEPAGSGSPRLALEGMEHRGLRIEAGSPAIPCAPSGNRDPAVYADPDRFDITREHPRPMLTFGGGVHYCLGASLARFEIQEALPILARRLPGLATQGEVVWRIGSQIRGPETLPLRFERAG
jgi:cytochrome P450